MARELGPNGVHVAYIVIDAVIDVPSARERFNDKPDDFFIAPAATPRLATRQRAGSAKVVQCRSQILRRTW